MRKCDSDIEIPSNEEIKILIDCHITYLKNIKIIKLITKLYIYMCV